MTFFFLILLIPNDGCFPSPALPTDKGGTVLPSQHPLRLLVREGMDGPEKASIFNKKLCTKKIYL